MATEQSDWTAICSRRFDKGVLDDPSTGAGAYRPMTAVFQRIEKRAYTITYSEASSKTYRPISWGLIVVPPI